MVMKPEELGPADRIIQTVLAYSDHMVHNRPGMVVKDAQATALVKWSPVTHRVEGGHKVVYRLEKVGKKSVRVKVGVLQDTGQIKDHGGRIVGEYRPAGLFPEVVVWMYKQVAEVWRLDNEFAARWASYQFGQEHRDLKVVLAAFMLCQSRKGEPVLDGGKVAFHDEDYRDVGEAMMLLVKKDHKDLNPKLLLRIHDVLTLPGVAAQNRELGFGKSGRNAFLGRWDKAVEKWLRYREENPKLLEGLMKAGFRTTVMELAKCVGYKPSTPKFFELLRWKQVQAKDGRREVGIGAKVAAAESWDDLSEAEICERIVRDKPGYKRIVGLVPKRVGLTRAIVAAAVEAGSFSMKDLIIASPTFEELGLMEVPIVRERWEQAVKSAEDMRATNIATRIKSTATKEKLLEASDVALKKAAAEVTKNIRTYVIVDISGSMQNAIEAAKSHIARFLQGFPPDRVHVAVFNTQGRELKIPHPSAAGVENAFRGIVAAGGTDHGAGIRALAAHKPSADEDALFLFVGDEQQSGTFDAAFAAAGIQPMAFGFVRVQGSDGVGHHAIQDTAGVLGIPCFLVDERTFADPYAIPRTIHALVAATPVAAKRAGASRVSLAETILKTKLLEKPAWA
jgi:hypothetical protein